MTRILAIETSCDDTCAAVLDGPNVLSNVVSSQARLHARYGGIVPEVASRKHLELINPVLESALEDAGSELGEIDAIAVTAKPGLIGALLVGVNTAKSLAAATGKPLIPVDHLHGHVAAAFLEPDPLEPPFLALIASGGHTLLAEVHDHRTFAVAGQTLDDAAGEALDKAARLLGLGFPGGPAIQREAEAVTRSALPVADRDEPTTAASTSASAASRRRSSMRCATSVPRRPRSAAPTSRRAFRARSSASSSRSCAGRSRPEGGRRSRSAAASRRTRLLRERTAELCAERGVRLSSCRPSSAPTTQR